jgi:hypothetical protein
MYRIHPGAGVIRTSDGAHITRTHPDWPDYQAWVKAGNTPDTAEAPVRDIAAERERMWSQIKQMRDRRTLQGGFPAAGAWFHSDLKSRSQQLGLVMMGASIPAGLAWKTMDGSFVEMTQALAGEIFAAAAAQEQATFAAAEAHKAAMEAADHPLQHDYSRGWPIVFGETQADQDPLPEEPYVE